MDIWVLQGGVWTIALLVSLAVKGFAFVNAMLYTGDAYDAAGKLTKQAWGLITGIGLAAQLIIPSPLGIINLVFLIAAFVYLADVRPALKDVTSYRR